MKLNKGDRVRRNESRAWGTVIYSSTVWVTVQWDDRQVSETYTPVGLLENIDDCVIACMVEPPIVLETLDL